MGNLERVVPNARPLIHARRCAAEGRVAQPGEWRGLSLAEWASFLSRPVSASDPDGATLLRGGRARRRCAVQYDTQIHCSGRLWAVRATDPEAGQGALRVGRFRVSMSQGEEAHVGSFHLGVTVSPTRTSMKQRQPSHVGECRL